MEHIIFRVFKIEKSDNLITLFFAIKITNFHTGLKIIVKYLITLFKTSAFNILNFENCLIYRRCRQPPINISQSNWENVRNKYVPVILSRTTNIWAK